jgi:hypothetical protein
MTKLLTILFLFLGLTSCLQTEKKYEVRDLKNTLDSVDMALTTPSGKNYSLDDIYQKYIPSELLSYIEISQPTWSVPGQNMWYPQLFNKYQTDSSLVNYVSGDFDCNGKRDYALIMDKGMNHLAAIAFLRVDNGFKTVELTELLHSEGQKIDFVLSLYKPGRYDIVDPDLLPSDPNYVNLKGNSVGIGLFNELYEGGADVYYWDEGQLRSCVIDD